MRHFFPALKASHAFLDNAGGTQVPQCVIDAVLSCYTDSFGQRGGAYPASERAGAIIQRAHDVVGTFVNATDRGTCIIGSSSTSLLHLIASAYADALKSGEIAPHRNKIIVSALGHEANVHPWTRLATRGFEIVMWEPRISREGRHMTARLCMDSLRELLDDRTLLVVFPECSNIIGQREDSIAITKLAHAKGARVVVDAVASAPHRLPDVTMGDFDWLVYSTYKVFGPHAAALYGSFDAFKPLTGPNHWFIPRESLPYKFELGGVSHESAAGIGALDTYMRQFIGADGTRDSRGVFTEAFRKIEAIEGELLECLLGKLRADDRVGVIGDPHVSPDRIAIVSFTVKGRTSESVARELSERGMGVKRGDFYSRRLIERLGIPVDDGVVRISLAHYNTREEIERLNIS